MKKNIKNNKNKKLNHLVQNQYYFVGSQIFLTDFVCNNFLYRYNWNCEP